MKKTLLFLLTLATLLAACGGGEAQPLADQQIPTAAPALSPTDTPQPNQPIVSATEIIPVKLEPQEGDTRAYVDGTSLVYIPAGEFEMGVKDGEDNPIHTAYTDGFWIYTTEVTNAQYDLCVLLGQCTPADEKINPSDRRIDSLPVTGVQHEQAQGYCEWIRGRLPTEAEWEKAARGKDAFPYPWGDEEPTCDKSNFSDCQKRSPDTVIAREAGRSPYQLFDMAGNVFEWVQDWYDPDAYTKGILLDEHKVVRGGAFNSSAEDLKAYVRFFELPNIAREDLGFRCVLEQDAIDSSENSSFGNMCVLPPVVAPAPQDASCPAPTIKTSSYCENGQPRVSFKIDWEAPIDGHHGYTWSLPDTCKALNNQPGFQNILVCSGQEFSNIKITVPYVCNKPIVEYQCQPGYVFDPETQLCTYANEPNINQGESCPKGLVFNEEVKCCQMPSATHPPICPAGFDFNGKSCSASGKTYANAFFPSCSIADKPTPTPKPGDDPEPEPTPTCDPATGAGCPADSDMRLKTDIVRVGETESGLPLYTFRYIGGTTVYRGVMAQDVLTVRPEAVVLMPNGYLAVYYQMLGLVMEPVE